MNLPLQFTGRPASVDRFSLVERPRLGPLYPKEEAVVGPGQFGTQCVANWIGQIERPHVLKVAAIKTPSKFGT
jgi:hypothetical protein